MLILKEVRENNFLQERETSYTKVSPTEAWDRLAALVKRTKEFRVHLSFLTADSTDMEGFYNKARLEGSKITFLDSRTAFNNLRLYLRDITAAEVGEDAEADFEIIRFDLRSKEFASITRWR
jgi:hypothetical protein